MIRGPAGRCRIDAIEPEVAQFQRIDEHIDRANRIALVDPIIKAFRQQRRLLAIRPLNETLHQFPRRFSKGIIASMGFSHSLGQTLENLVSSITSSALPQIADIRADEAKVCVGPIASVGPYPRHVRLACAISEMPVSH